MRRHMFPVLKILLLIRMMKHSFFILLVLIIIIVRLNGVTIYKIQNSGTQSSVIGT